MLTAETLQPDRRRWSHSQPRAGDYWIDDKMAYDVVCEPCIAAVQIYVRDGPDS